MGAETQAVSVMEVKSNFDQLRPPDLVSIDLPASRVNGVVGKTVEKNSDVAVESQYVRCIRYMEDEHIRIDDLSSCLMAMEAASFIKKHAMKLFFDDFQFPQTFKADEAEMFSDELEESMRRAFQMADLALADDPTVNASSGTTALAPLIFGRLLVVANAGDCRAVLCRKGGAVDMSQDHRPVHQVEKRRVVELGGFIDDGYLNGLLSVSRALGDWDMKLPRGSPSPLVTEAEFRQTVLTEDDKFMIMGCDRIWDVMTSQQAVSLVRRGLRRHDDPQQCARELVAESLLLNTFDNLTVVVVCFSDTLDHRQPRCCSLSAEALCSLKSLLDRRDNSR